MSKDKESTAHRSEQPPRGEATAPGDGPMPMGMTGGTATAGAKDKDQRSTHVAPKTVESRLPDGSPTYADPGTNERKAPQTSASGKYEVVTRIVSAEYRDDGDRRRNRFYEPGEIVQLDEKEALSFGDAIKPASEK